MPQKLAIPGRLGDGRGGPPAEPLALLAAIVESSEDAIVSKDLNGMVTSWNEAAEALFGYSAEEMIGRPILQIIPPELHDEERLILSKIRAGEKVSHFVSERLRKDGRRVEVALTISPVRDVEGRVIGASKIARDMTRQRQAERTAAILAAIVQNSDDAIISLDLRGVVTSWNPAAERFYGYSAAEMVGHPIQRVIPLELVREEDQILARIRAGELVDHFQTARLRKDGSRISVSITVSPIRDARGRIVGASKIARDITPQLEAQARKDQFLAILAHELRNPLAPVRNAVALFRSPGASPEVLEKAQLIAERQLAHLSRLVEDLLDVSRLSTGRVKLRKVRVDLCALMDEALAAVAPMVESHGHTLDARCDERPLWTTADPARVAQVVHNLVTNAAKYTDRGGCIRVRLRREHDEAVLVVEDNGMGMSPEIRARLFRLFEQDPTAMERAAGGLGIGLALVREFVERHGGTVAAESEGPGKGSRFTVRLPLERAPA